MTVPRLMAVLVLFGVMACGVVGTPLVTYDADGFAAEESGAPDLPVAVDVPPEADRPEAADDLDVPDPADAPSDPADAPSDPGPEVVVPVDTCTAPAAAALANAGVPDGYCAWTWASGLSAPRGMAVAANGDRWSWSGAVRASRRCSTTIATAFRRRGSASCWPRPRD